MFTHWKILTLLALTIPAHAADGRYLLHPTGVSCFIAPCPDWEVTDRQTGEHFVAVAEFSGLAVPPPGSADLVAEGRRVKLNRPSGDGTYEVLTITAIISTTPAVSGHRP